MINFNNEGDWGWEDWVEALTLAVLKHADVKATEIYADDMNENFIYLRVKEWDEATSEYIEVQYLLYYVDAVESLHRNLLFFYMLYQPKGKHSIVRDCGAYQIARDNDTGHCFALDI